MAGSYPDEPNYRFAWDRDGTLGFYRHTSTTEPTIMTGAEKAALNDEAKTLALNFGGNASYWVGMVFPQPRTISAILYHYDSSPEKDLLAQVSTDTTNGVDGTWTDIAWPGNIDQQNYRSSWTSYSGITGIRGLRLRRTVFGTNNPTQVHDLYVWGVVEPGPDRLRLWHPTLDSEVPKAYFDWGDVPRSTDEIRTFRVKNDSALYTANNISLSMDALYTASPTMPSQHTFSLDGTTYASTLDIGSLAPGAISPTLYLRRNTPADAPLSIWAARIIATAASFT